MGSIAQIYAIWAVIAFLFMVPLFCACYDPRLWIFAPIYWVVGGGYFVRVLRQRVSKDVSLILSRDTICLLSKTRTEWKIPWSEIGEVERNSSNNNLIFRDREGSTLGQTPPFLFENGRFTALMATMKLRTPSHTQFFRVGEKASGKRKTRLATGWSFTLGGLLPLSYGIHLLQLSTLPAAATALILVGSLLLSLGGKDLFVAYGWHELSGQKSPLEKTLEGALLPYIHWLLAGDPIEGDFAFQYATNDLKDVKVRFFPLFLLLGITLPAAALVLYFLGFATSLIFLFFMGFVIGQCTKSMSKKRNLLNHRLDEIVLTQSTISVWHAGVYRTVEIKTPPKVRLDGRFKSELKLLNEDVAMLYDPLEITVLR